MMECWTHLRRSRAWLAGWAIAMGALAPAWAKDSKDPKEVEARAAFQEAQTAYDLGKFKEALEGYTRAYELKPLPAFLFNIAQVHRQAHRWERASFFFKRYLDLSPGTPANVQVVKELISECDAKAADEERQKRELASATKQLELAKAEAERAQAQSQAERDAVARLQKEQELKKQAGAKAPAPPLARPAPTAAVAPKPQPVPAAALPRLVTAPPAAVEGATPLYKQWWFWTGVGVVVAGATITTVYYQTNNSPTSLGTINAR